MKKTRDFLNKRRALQLIAGNKLQIFMIFLYCYTCFYILPVSGYCISVLELMQLLVSLTDPNAYDCPD